MRHIRVISQYLFGHVHGGGYQNVIYPSNYTCYYQLKPLGYSPLLGMSTLIGLVHRLYKVSI